MPKKDRRIRVDPSFYELISNFQKDTTKVLGRKPSSRETTRYISSFLIEEDLYPWTVKGVTKNKNRRRGGWL